MEHLLLLVVGEAGHDGGELLASGNDLVNVGQVEAGGGTGGGGSVLKEAAHAHTGSADASDYL